MSIIMAAQWEDGEGVKMLSVIVNGEYWDIYSYGGKIVNQQKGRYIIDIEPHGKYLTAIVGSYLPPEEILDYIRRSHEFVGEALQKWNNGEIDRSELACSIHESADWLASMAKELSFIGE